MQKKLPYYVVNAFTNKAFGGNPAAVFLDSQELTNHQMQSIAKQMNLVETVFVAPSAELEIDFQLRFFTPFKEVPIAGHPTIAAWVVLVITDLIEPSQNRKFLQKTQNGSQQISIEHSRDQLLVWMRQFDPQFLGGISDRQRVVDVLGIREKDLISGIPVEAINTGLGHLVVGVKSLEALGRVRRNTEALNALCDDLKISEVQVFCEETYDPAFDFHTRNISPRDGREDPACGIGNSALLAFLMKNYFPKEAEVLLQVEQGQVVNMPSNIFLKGKRNSQDMLELLIGGSGVVMMQGNFFL